MWCLNYDVEVRGGVGEVMPWCGTMGVYGDGEAVCRNSGWGGYRWL